MTGTPPSTEFWAAMFDGTAEAYDQSGVPFFGPIAEGLVRRLAPAPGERILDVGSGRGAATIPLAEAVGPGGSVTAIDASGRMVELLDAALAQRGLANATVAQGDAVAPPAGPYDAVCASLLLFFLPDPIAGLAAWRERLAEGGRVGISTFAEWPPSMRVLMDVLAAHRPADAGDTTQMPPAFESDDGVEALFEAAGLGDVRTDHAVYDIPFRDVDQFVTWSKGTALAGLWMHVPPDKVPEAVERLDAELRSRDHTLQVDIRYTLAGG